MGKLLVLLGVIALSSMALAGIANAADLVGEETKEERVLRQMAENDPELAKTIIEALQSMEKHPYHHLERALREDIYLKLDGYDQDSCGKRQPSRILLAEKELALVRPLWHRVWKDDQVMTDLCEKFGRAARAETREEKAALLANWEQGWKKARDWTQQTLLKDTKKRLHRFPESLAGLAAAAALIVAGEGAIRPEQASHFFTQDTPEEFWYEDMDFYAASAYAGGLPYPMDGFSLADPEKYRKYWRWWLLEALPESLAK